MFTIQYDEEFIDQIASKIAIQATKMLIERINNQNQLPLLLTRSEAMEILRCSTTKMAELMNRSDFPVNRDFGQPRIPTHMLLKWIEAHTNDLEKKLPV